MEDRPNTPPPTGDERQTAMLCHLLGFAHLLFPFAGILGPFLLWNAKKDDSDYIDRHGKESINFQITFTLITLGLVLLMFGSFMQAFFGSDPSPVQAGYSFGGAAFVAICLAIIGLAEVVLMILAAVAASSGREFRYPVRIQFLK